ncbi:Vesicle transport through interaction with t-SNAREs 1, partial [Fasciolopsis buskii]
ILQNRVLLAGIGFFIIIVFIVALYLVSQRQYNAIPANPSSGNVPAPTRVETQPASLPSVQLDNIIPKHNTGRNKRSLLLAAYGLF